MLVPYFHNRRFHDRWFRDRRWLGDRFGIYEPQTDPQSNGNGSRDGARADTVPVPAQFPQQEEADGYRSPEPFQKPPQKPPQKPRRKSPQPWQVLAIVALLAGLGYGVYRLFFLRAQPDGIFLSGRIEGYETDVSARIGGRVGQVAVREGDNVQPEQLLARLDDAEIQAQLRGAQAQVQAARERLERARQELPVLQAQLEEAQLTTQQAGQTSQGQVLEAQGSLAAARSQFAEAQQSAQLAQTTQQRTRQLFESGAVSAQQLDQDTAALNTARARVAAAQQQIAAAQGRVAQAQATASNPAIQATSEARIRQQIVQAQTDIATAQQEVRTAQANEAQVRANLNYLTVTSPLAGTVITRSTEPGEVVAAGAPLLTLVNLNTLYLRGFVPGGEVGRVQLGQRALVYLDAFPNQPLEATVTRVDPQASFTPENTYFREDRVTQVFGVELTLTNPQGFAKPGLPADARILAPEPVETNNNVQLPVQPFLPAVIDFFALPAAS